MCTKTIYLKVLILLTLGVLFGHPSFGQAGVSPCGHHHAQEALYQQHPDARKRAAQIEKEMLKGFKTQVPKTADEKSMDPLYTIPVVVHVIYGCEEGDENISDERVVNTIAQLNRDFQGTSVNDAYTADPLSVPYYSDRGTMSIEFVLADKDPQGNPTTGITRTKSELSFAGVGFGSALRDLVYWDRDQYLNVYVVGLINGVGSSGVAIYPKDAEAYPQSDGLAMAYWAMDPQADNADGIDRSNYHSIITHEVGHWLGLRHIWGDGNGVAVPANCDIDDFDFAEDDPMYNTFNDTPNTLGNSTIRSTDNCGDAISTCTPHSENDMLENFMDYTGCTVMFSAGQVAYMDKALNSTVAERNNLHTVGNLAATLYQGTDPPRLIFLQDIFYDDSETAGVMTSQIEVKVRGSNNNGDFKFQNLNADITGHVGFTNLPNNFTKIVQTTSDTTATISISGAYNPANPDITDLGITFSSSAFNYAPTPSLVSKDDLVVDWYQNDITYLNYTTTVGSKSDYFRSYGYNKMGLYYKDFTYFVNMGSNVEVLVDANNQVARLTEGAAIASGNGLSWQDNEFVADLKIIDEADVENNLEDFFYIGLRLYDDCGAKLAWLRVMKTDCNQLRALGLGHLNFYDQTLNAGELDGAYVIFREDAFTEDLVDNGTFSQNIVVELLGSSSNYFVSNNSVSQSPVDGNPLASTPTFSGSLLGNNKTLNLSYTTIQNLSSGNEVKVLPHQLINQFMNGSANVVYNIDTLRMIYYGPFAPTPDYYDFTSLSYLDNEVGPNSQTNVSPGFYLKSLNNEYFYGPNLSYADGIFQIYSSLNDYKMEAAVLYDGPSSIYNVASLEEGTLIGDAGITENGVLRSDIDFVPINGQFEFGKILLHHLGNVCAQQGEFFVGLRILLDCDDFLYGWVRLNLVGDEIELLDLLINQEPNADITTGIDFSCSFSGTTNEDSYIAAVAVDDQVVTSGNDGGYKDHTIDNAGPSFTIQPNSQLTLSRGYYAPNCTVCDPTISACFNSLFPQQMTWTVWLDKNQDGLFQQSERSFVTTPATGTYVTCQDLNLSFDVSSFESGIYKMRVSLSQSYIAGGDGCATIPAGEFGEGEDFWVEVVNPPCALSPNNVTNNAYINSVNVYENGSVLYSNPNINNNGYGDYTNSPISIEQGKTYSLYTTFIGNNDSNNLFVWIDYNQNELFEESAGELIINESIDGLNNITIPTDFATSTHSLGTYTMRIKKGYFANTDPCMNPNSTEEVEDYTLVICENPNANKIRLKALLEGPYNTTTNKMNTTLMSSNLLPSTAPFDRTPWHYDGGEVVDFTSLGYNVVDWVLVEARDPASLCLLDRQAALLDENGIIRSICGTDGLTFPQLENGQSYVFNIHHRNHLSIMTASPQTYPSTSLYDMSNTSNVHPDTPVKVSGGKALMYGGNFDGNETIENEEYSLYQDQVASTSVYLEADANLDGIVNNLDNNLHNVNTPSSGVFYQAEEMLFCQWACPEIIEECVMFKAFLEGPYNSATGTMNTDLYDLNALPITQPYTAAPWDYFGEEIMIPLSLPNNLVDWILIEAIEPNNCEVVESLSAILLSDGSIVSPDFGNTCLGFKTLTVGEEYYFRLNHRNHLSITTAETQTFPFSGVYDFTNDVFQTYGRQQSVTELASNVYGMTAGNVVGTDEVILALDYNKVFANAQSSSSDYSKFDLNLDGETNDDDVILVSNNLERYSLTACDGLYCSTFGNAPSQFYITAVNFANTTYTSVEDPNGYGDYTTSTFDVTENNTYTFSLTGFREIASWGVACKLWIDFDQDLIFEEEEAFTVNVVPGNDYTGQPNEGVDKVFTSSPITINVPNNLISGDARMRVSIQQYSQGDTPSDIPPCGNLNTGEVEDYTVNITGTGTIDPPNNGDCEEDVVTDITVQGTNTDEEIVATNSICVTDGFMSNGNDTWLYIDENCEPTTDPNACITVTAPTGGNYYPGDVVTIEWTHNSTDSYPYFKLEFSDDGVNWFYFTAVDRDQGSASWTLPNSICGSNQARFRVSEYNNINCNDVSEFFTIVNPNANCTQYRLGNSPNEVIEVYPNPTTGFVEIISQETIQQIQLFDVAGRLLKDLQIDQLTTAYQLDLSDLQDGMYLLSVNGYEHQRIVKQ